MVHRFLSFAVMLVWLWIVVSAGEAKAKDVEILWDQWGIPHIYSGSDEGAFYGMGWAQAKRHGDLLLRMVLQARGVSAQFLGEGQPDLMGRTNVEWDRWSRTLNITGVAREWEKSQSPQFKSNLQAFADGINDYVRQHPTTISSDLRAALPITVVDVLAHLYRTFHVVFYAADWRPVAKRWALKHGWTLESGPVAALQTECAVRGSNAVALAPSRSRSGHAMLMVNPHLPFEDMFRWFEAQVVTSSRGFYGITLVGDPVLEIGFNDVLGWSDTYNLINGHTLYELTLTEDGGYLFDSKSVAFKTRREVIEVRKADGSFKEITLNVRESVHGPVVDELIGIKKAGRAIALRIAGTDRPHVFDEYWEMEKAASLGEFQGILGRMQLPFLNLVYADREGHIFLKYNGLSPVRLGSDYNYWYYSVIPGHTSQTLAQDYVPYAQLPEVQDPPSGWVQNANDPPWTTTLPSPLIPSSYPAALTQLGPVGFRPQHAIAMLQERDKIGFEEFVAMKHNTRVFAADRLLGDLVSAVRRDADPLVQQSIRVLEAWDRNVLPDSRGAVLFYEWYKEAKFSDWEDQGYGEGLFAVPWSADKPTDTPAGLADPVACTAALKTAAKRVIDRYGSLDVPWGQVYRLQLAGKDLPANGGPSTLGIYRALDHFKELSDHRFNGTSGDSSMMLIQFDPHPRAEAVMLPGNATQPNSKHDNDQLQLFVDRRTRPVWSERADVEIHLEAREVLHIR